MIPFSCPACRKKLAVKEELAGKKVRCPGCGQGVNLPAPAALTPSGEAAAPGPRAGDHDGREERTQASPPAGSDVRTQQSSSDPDATLGAGRPDAGHDPRLTEFLAPSQADDELGRLGKYRILKILGHGGMGVVFQAEDPKLRRLVAIKAMLPDLAASASAGQRFLREAQAMAAVKHDHIATIYQVDEERGVSFLAMEFLTGEPLEERLQRNGKLPVPEVLRIGREMAEGLDAAHATGLIHRDIKPANVWLETRGDGRPACRPDEETTGGPPVATGGRVKILDFGLARAVSQDAGLTQQGTVVGTPAYMAPEQARGETVDARCDLFSLGCVLYRMITGRQAFQGKDVVSTLLAVASHEPIPPARLEAGVPQELSDLVMRLLEKDAARRPASAGAVAEALRDLEAKRAGPKDGRDETVSVRPAAARARSGRRRALLALAVGLVVLVPLVWWLAGVVLRVETAKGTLVVEINNPETEARVKDGKLILTGPDDQVRYTLEPAGQVKELDAGEYRIHVEGTDGLTLDTREFTLKKGGQVAVRVTAAPRAAAKAGDPDRSAAEWVLSLGGTVRVNDEDRDIKAAADLPREPFRLTGVVLKGNEKVTDAGLGHLKDCTRLTSLDLAGTPVSDAGMVHFQGCKGLRILFLATTHVGDAGLAPFKGCKGLINVNLAFTPVGDAGLAPLSDCKDLAGLGLQGTRVTDAGLAPFKGWKGLTYLHLGDTQVTDAGLASFKDCKRLRYLYLDGTRVTDAGLAAFADCKTLEDLALQKTKVTGAEVAKLRQALPQCRIVWDGAAQPAANPDPDRRAAEWVLSVGGAVRVNDQGRDIKAAADLPRELFRLTWVDLHDNKQASDAGLAHFDGCKNLLRLYLGGTPVTDGGLAHFEDCKGLTFLSLWDTQVGDRGLAHFQGCKGLTGLQLSNTQVSDVGLAFFKDCKGLTSLGLTGTKVSDAGLAAFKDCKKLTNLGLGRTRVSDAGLAAFKDCKNLSILYLGGTPVSDAGLAPFKDCKDLTALDLEGTQVDDAGLAVFKDCKGLMEIRLGSTRVTDAGLRCLAGCRLTQVGLGGTQVSDLSPLKGMPLTWLNCQNTRVTDLSPLQGMPLKELLGDFRPERDTAVLRSLKNLETINGKPAAEFWKDVGAKKP